MDRCDLWHYGCPVCHAPMQNQAGEKLARFGFADVKCPECGLRMFLKETTAVFAIYTLPEQENHEA